MSGSRRVSNTMPWMLTIVPLLYVAFWQLYQSRGWWMSAGPFLQIQIQIQIQQNDDTASYGIDHEWSASPYSLIWTRANYKTAGGLSGEHKYKKQITKKTNTNTKTNNLDHEWCAPLIPLSEQTKRVVVVSVVWWPATSHRTRANELLTSHANPYKNREIQIQIQIYSITNVFDGFP